MIPRTLLASVFVLWLASPAFGVDPQCVGNTDHRAQPSTATFDYSGGTYSGCLTERDVNGNPLPTAVVISCKAALVGEDGTTAIIDLPSGVPGSFFTGPVPAGIEGTGTIQGGPCTIPGSSVGDVAKVLTGDYPPVTAPPPPTPPPTVVAPRAPVFLP